MSSNKTISINPHLFSIHGSKTKKNREPKSKSTHVPLISPSVLKNKLLKRIKEHKQKENQKSTENNITINPSLKDDVSFSNEFNDSIEYLQSLSKKKKTDEERMKNEQLKQKRREELEKRTVKNYSALNHYVETGSAPLVNIELPLELQNIEVSHNGDAYKINEPDVVPYGILKGGTKPTYRQWAKTQRNPVVLDPNSSLLINNENVSRENRLNLLKEKIRRKNVEIKTDPVTSNIASSDTLPNIASNVVESNLVSPNLVPNIQPNIQPNLASSNLASSNLASNNGKIIVGTKHITKKTIKHKYSLGRSNVKRRVSILIKDNRTRKRVITAQKELKRKNINDIKEYLRKHNLWSVGSNAPNDVLRQMYESAMLSGEITNFNTEKLLHNLSKE